MLRHFGRRGFRGGIVRDKHFLIRLRHYHGDQAVMLQNGFVGQGLLPVGYRKHFQLLGLGKRGRAVLAFHGLQQIPLLRFRQIGKLHSGGQGNFLFIHHLQNLRDEIGQADVAFDLRRTVL